MFLTLLLTAVAVAKEWYWLGLLLLPVIVALFFNYYRFHKKVRQEVEQFVESVHYRDFSRHFEVKKAPGELQPFRSGFNEINTTFKSISKEKETQFLHLKSILEIVDTGILSYETTDGEILWMNEALKTLLMIPYLKTIHSLQKRNEKLYEEITGMAPGQKLVTSVIKDNSPFKIQLSATVFSNGSRTYKLIAFQNINQALDESESQAWQKLLSVMTHEIMNSVAPISSLAETLKNRIALSDQQPDNYRETLADIETGVGTIKKRSEGLLKFTETYRSLSKINKVNLSQVPVVELFGHVQQLMQPNLEERKIELEVILRDPLLIVKADAGLVEQVLINLLLNAMDAVREVPQPKIGLSAVQQGSRVQIFVRDNGPGIGAELLDKIFIPFFSTKKTGNGIGLSLSKQVMVLHRGAITAHSAPGEGAVFVLSFEGN